MPFYWQLSRPDSTVSVHSRSGIRSLTFVRYWYIYGLSILDDGDYIFHTPCVEVSNGKTGRHHIVCSAPRDSYATVE